MAASECEFTAAASARVRRETCPRFRRKRKLLLNCLCLTFLRSSEDKKNQKHIFRSLRTGKRENARRQIPAERSARTKRANTRETRRSPGVCAAAAGNPRRGRAHRPQQSRHKKNGAALVHAAHRRPRKSPCRYAPVLCGRPRSARRCRRRELQRQYAPPRAEMPLSITH